MNDFIDYVVRPIGFIVMAAVALIATVAGAHHAYQYLVYKPECARFAVLSGHETYWSFGTDCIVKLDGDWVTYGVAVAKKQEITVKQR